MANSGLHLGLLGVELEGWVRLQTHVSQEGCPILLQTAAGLP